MHGIRRLGIVALLLGSVHTAAAEPLAHLGPLARQAGSILRRSCARCHRGQSSESGYAFNILDSESLVREGVVVKHDPDSSSLLEMVHEGRMPPRNRPQLSRPSAAEVAILRDWIAAGAPPLPPPEPRPGVTLTDELRAVVEHLRGVAPEDRSNWRYLTLSNLHNDGTVDASTIDVARMAAVKVLNSLSWSRQLFVPVELGAHRTLLAVHIKSLGWERKHWNALLAAYPYALSYGSLGDPEPEKLDTELQSLRGKDVLPAILRADWLVARGSQPPLYYALLYDLTLTVLDRPADGPDPSNPRGMTDADLEHHLGLETTKAIAAGAVARAGFTNSGVSGQNRLVERHTIRADATYPHGGYYWKSYDFKASTRRAILSVFPLGPRFPTNPFNDLAFDHDGGEIIFSLPNGLQGYLLVDGGGRRIDAGPIEVVGDALKTSGNEQIVAGVSCMACHRQGLLDTPADEIRGNHGVFNAARDRVSKIYPRSEDFSRLVADDRRRFVTTLDALFGPAPGGGSVTDQPEPVGETARWYLLEPVGLESAAAELHVSPQRLRQAIEFDPNLTSLGMRVILRDDGGFHRAAWESPAEFPLFKEVARRLDFDPR